MALISCPECKKSVSDIAQSCPHCGYPITEPKKAYPLGEDIKTIQETSKRLKLQIVISSVIFWFGLVALFSVEHEGDAVLIPSLMTFLGLLWYLITRIRIWWHHK